MKLFAKISTAALIAFLLFATSSCKKEQKTEDIYQLLSGIWETGMSGAPTLYLIGNEELKMYMYTYPYPIEEADKDAGWFEVNPHKHTLLFTNALTLKEVTYTYELRDGGNTLQLNNIIYKRSDLN